MIVVPPVTLTPDNSAVVGSLLPSTANGEAVWSSGTTYNIGDQVVSALTGRRYTSLIASNLNHALPTVRFTSNAQWQDNGYVNRYASLDYTSNRQCISDTGSLEFILNPSNLVALNGNDVRVDTLGMINVDADFVEIKALDVNGATILDVTETLFSRTIEDWKDYFFKRFSYRRNVFRSNLPLSQNNQFQITLTKSSGANCACGPVVFGASVYLGETQYDPTVSTINYSTITADAFGNTTLIARRSVPNLTVTTQIPAINVDDALAVKDDLNAVAALWSGLDDDTQPYFGSLLTFGVYTQFDIDPFSIDKATVTLQLQGL